MSVTGIGYGAISSYLGAYGSKPTDENISDKVTALIAEMDADGDGQLTVEESEVSAELFNQADSDGDGFVTEEELLAMMQKVRPHGPPPQNIEDSELAEPDGEELAARILSRHDADGDGVLTLEESGVDAAAFSQADSDGDGLVTKEELVAMVEGGKPEGPPPGMDGEMGPPPGGSVGDMAAAIMEELDSDSDGGLSSSETAASEEVFDAMDTNEDGVVSQAELEAAMATIMGSVQSSGLGFGAQAVNAAGGMAAYRQEMDRLILSALIGGETGSDSSGILADTGATGSISLTA